MVGAAQYGLVPPETIVPSGKHHTFSPTRRFTLLKVHQHPGYRSSLDTMTVRGTGSRELTRMITFAIERPAANDQSTGRLAASIIPDDVTCLCHAVARNRQPVTSASTR